MISRLVIVGVGLIGGSVALSLRRAGAVKTIVGVGRSESSLVVAKNLKIVDEISMSLSEAIKDADMIILAVPLTATIRILRQLGPTLESSTVLTDVGSAKEQVVFDARESLGKAFCRFVPGHPIAGSEDRGATAAFADLFKNHRVLLTPVEETDVDAVAKVKNMWEATGAIVSQLDANTHDRKLAITSHLPHIIAYNLMNLLIAEGGEESFLDFMGGGFRDATRIASSAPEMWTDIVMNNREQVLSACQRYMDKFTEFMEALENKDDREILMLFEKGKKARDRCFIPEANKNEK